MSRLIVSLIVICLFATLPAGALQAADANTNETRLRDLLRNALIQARNAENDRAVLEAASAELKQKNETLTKQVEALTKQSKADRESADKTIADFKTKVAATAAQLAKAREELEQSRAEFKAAQADGQNKEAARAKLASDAIVLQRIIADQKTRNNGLYKLGTEILRRYEKFGLGEALGAKEPFVGTTRVKLENFVQDYQDKLTDQKIKPQPAAGPQPPAQP